MGNRKPTFNFTILALPKFIIQKFSSLEWFEVSGVSYGVIGGLQHGHVYVRHPDFSVTKKFHLVSDSRLNKYLQHLHIWYNMTWWVDVPSWEQTFLYSKQHKFVWFHVRIGWCYLVIHEYLWEGGTCTYIIQKARFLCTTKVPWKWLIVLSEWLSVKWITIIMCLMNIHDCLYGSLNAIVSNCNKARQHLIWYELDYLESHNVITSVAVILVDADVYFNYNSWCLAYLWDGKVGLYF